MKNRHFLMGAVALATVLVSGASAQAKTIALTDAELKRLESVENAYEHLRVNLSRHLIIERRASTAGDVEVEGGIDLVFQDKILTETVMSKAQGKVIAVESETLYTSLGIPVLPRKIFVSFSADCTTKACAFEFRRPYTKDYYMGAEFHSNGYFLSAIPANENYEATTIFSKKGLMKREMVQSENIYRPVSGLKYGVHLQVDSDVLRNVIKKSVKHPGWE